MSDAVRDGEKKLGGTVQLVSDEAQPTCAKQTHHVVCEDDQDVGLGRCFSGHRGQPKENDDRDGRETRHVW